MRCISIPESIHPYRIHKIGIDGNTIFVHVNRQETVELWSLNTLIPNSWQILAEFKLEEIIYAFPAFCYYSDYLYILIIGRFAGEDVVNCSIFRINRFTKEIKEYILDISSLEEFYRIPFEHAVLGVGKDSLHIYDRGGVMGPIKYWTIMLLEESASPSFILERNDIEDSEPNAKCSRFPIEIDAEKGIFARLRDDNCLFVSSRSSAQWDQYLLSADSHIDLHHLTTRGLHETYGRQGHRVAALESPLTVYSDGGTVIAKVTRGRRHLYYRIELDNEKKEFRCVSSGSALLNPNMDRMFYAMVSPQKIVILGLRNIVVVQFQPMGLLENVIWSIQMKTAKRDKIGAYSAGLSLKDINKLCNYVNSLQICI